MSNPPRQPSASPSHNNPASNYYSPSQSQAQSQTPNPASIFRRSSYASVVAGAGAGAGPGGAFVPAASHPFAASASRALDTASPSSSFPPPSTSIVGMSHHRPLVHDSLGQSPWARRATTSSFNGTFFSAQDVTPPARTDIAQTFFIPSYLYASRYAEKLRQEHQKRQATLREARSVPSSASTSLSTSSSSVNLQFHPYSQSLAKPPASGQNPLSSHRGLSHDVVEHIPRPVFYADNSPNDPPQPLPTRWNEQDKNAGLELSAAGLEVKLAHFKRGSGDEASSVRADHPMPRMAGIYYFEVSILGQSSRMGSHTLVGIGFCGSSTNLNRLPGWEPNSYAYHSDDGQLYVTKDAGKPYGPKFSKGDIIGCGINFRTRTAFFTKNGHNIGVAFRDIRQDKLYPVIGLKHQNEQIRANFGQEPFVFDINAMIQAEKRIVLDDIAKADTRNLSPPLSERQIIHKLITQYLANDGFVETANTFARETCSENEVLSNTLGIEQSIIMQDTNEAASEAAGDAITRQHIRTAILSGNIDSALALTRQHYSSVLGANDLIYFRLRCRKFIEMIKQSSSSQINDESERRKGKKMSRSGNFDHDGVFGHQMELDDHVGLEVNTVNGSSRHPGTDWGGAMDAGATMADEASRSTTSMISDEDLMAYGTELRTEFTNDTRRDVKRELDNTLALMVYHNPKESSLRELLADSGRNRLAEELNSAILVSQGKASSSTLEQLVQQTEVLLQELGDDGGPGAFFNLTTDLLHRDQ